MTSWRQFAESDPQLATFGRELLEKYSLAYLGTVRADGGPRIHPVCPLITEGRLYIGIIRHTPKCSDLQRDKRFILHALPGPHHAEFFVRGQATQIDNPNVRQRVASVDDGSVLTADDDILFELKIELAYGAVYELHEENGHTRPVPQRRRWQASEPTPV